MIELLFTHVYSQVKSTIEEYQKLLPFENKTLHAIEEYDNLSEEEKMKKSDTGYFAKKSLVAHP